MDYNEKVFELLESTGLNWTVNKNQLFDSDGHETQSYGIFRNDTKDWLGTVGDRYTPLQNFEITEIILKAVEGIGINLTRGGLLNNGSKIYLQAELPTEYIGKSDVKRWITALNSHDGSTSVGFGSSNTTVVCQNTFYRAYGELQKFRHTTSMKDRIEIAQKDLRLTMEYDQKLMKSFKVMADTKITDNAIERVIRKIFDVTPDTKKADISTRKHNQIKDFANSLTKSVQEQGDTIWALFNGITRYTNYVSAPKEQEKKNDYLMTSGGANISNIGFNELMKFIEENTTVLV
jgi:phage/plasmid-like protein (TIGR03299 family)